MRGRIIRIPDTDYDEIVSLMRANNIKSFREAYNEWKKIPKGIKWVTIK